MATEFSGRGQPDRSLVLLWRRGPRRTKGPRPSIGVDDIVEAAVGIADAEGLEAVSMRRIADRLGVGTMSLYRHVPAKGELLDLMLDHVLSEPARPGPEVEGWRAKLELHARESLAHYRRHPWTLGVSMARPPLGPNLMANFESMLAAAAETGLPPGERLGVVRTVSAFVDGIARVELQTAQAERATGVSEEAWWEARAAFWEHFFVPEDHPAISATYEAGGFEDPVEPFEYGLARVLDGIAARVAEAGTS